jgi:head-tail adaptor
MWKPNIQQMSTPIKIQSRVETNVNGMVEISYIDKADDFCNWKGMGGTQSTQSGSVVVDDTAILTMWFNPDVSERDRVLLNHVTPYEIINVENVEMRNQYMLLKVKRVVNA